MSLAPGARLGPYEVIAAVGAGGMGEVYRARDMTLNRDVAIKVLPDLFARDPDSLARFAREAQTLAALNHPNVAQVFGAVEAGGAAGGPAALVMEFVDGEDLAQRISRSGAIPMEDALPIALQIACGLEAAHERGIVHRDLKPANVRITPDGTVKILDFGLAKAMSADGAGPTADPQNSPTFTSSPTEIGMIVGTAAYMAPEQARGKPVDKRADIWAFGCVLYEMLTARQPFKGETLTDMLAAVVKEEPDWTQLPSSTAPSLRRLIAQCLVKDVRQRVRDIGDARIVVERIIAGSLEEKSEARPAVTTTPGRRFGFVHLAAAALGLALVTGLATWRLGRPEPAPPPQPVRFVSAFPDGVTPVRGNGTGVAFSPDGGTVVFVAQPAGQSTPALYRRRMNAVDADLLPNTSGAFAPFFSPDSRWIGFFTDKAVMKLSLDGRGASKVCDRGPFSRADWGAGDTIVLGTSQASAPGALGKVSAAGGTPEPLTTLAGKDVIHQLPHVLPDGRHVLFTVLGPERVDLAIASLDGGAHELLDLEGSGAVFVAPDHLVFARADSMFAVSFDPQSRRVTGAPVPVLDDAGVFLSGPALRIPILGVDRAGSIAYLNKRSVASVLGWMGSGAEVTTIAVPQADYRIPRVSPDRRRVAATMGPPPDIWVIDVERGTRLRLTSTGGNYPIWSADGSRIAYSNLVGGGLTSIAADGSGTTEALLPNDAGTFRIPTSWSLDGTMALTVEDRRGGRGARNRDIWIFRRGAQPKAFLQSAADEHSGMISPDGQWLAYVSNVSGRDEIYVRALGPAGATIPVSNGGGVSPMWAPGGTALFFTNGSTLMRASATGSPLQIGAPAVARALPAAMGGIDIALDGRFLLVLRQNEGATRDLLHVLLNWGRTLQ